jgi:hypothetical protein
MACDSSLKETGMNYDMKLFLLFINYSFILLSAEFNNKQLMKCIYLRLMLSHSEKVWGHGLA